MNYMAVFAAFSVGVPLAVVGGQTLRAVRRARRALGGRPTRTETLADYSLPLGLLALGAFLPGLAASEAAGVSLPLPVPVGVIGFLFVAARVHAGRAVWHVRSPRGVRLRSGGEDARSDPARRGASG